MTELQLKQRTIEILRKEYPDVWFKKISDRFQSGIPDILGCLGGFFFAIELKSRTGRVERLQVHEIKEIHKAGGFAGVCNSVEEVRAFLNLIKGDPCPTPQSPE